MFSENFEEILQLEEHEAASNPEASGSKRRRIYRQQRPIPPVIELESDSNTSGQQKSKEKSTKIDLNKMKWRELYQNFNKNKQEMLTYEPT